jgi:hypothetical protein
LARLTERVSSGGDDAEPTANDWVLAESIKKLLLGNGLSLRQGTIIDTTIIQAQTGAKLK